MRSPSSFIVHHQSSLVTWLRGIWQNPAREDTNNMVARWKVEERTRSNKRSRHGSRHFLNGKRRDATAGHVLLSWAEHLPHRTCGTQRWTLTKFLVSFKDGDTQTKTTHEARPRLTRTLDEQQLWLTLDCLDSEDLYQLHPLARIKQRSAQWPEE